MELELINTIHSPGWSRKKGRHLNKGGPS